MRGAEKSRLGIYIFTFLYAAAVVLVTALCKSEHCLPTNRPRNKSGNFLSRHLTLTLTQKAAYPPETLLFTHPVAAKRKNISKKKKKKKKECDVFWAQVVTNRRQNVRGWHTAKTCLTVA